ncbi:MAG: hypothetical protein ACKO4Y_10250 [Flavobacteriales bacterium]
MKINVLLIGLLTVLSSCHPKTVIYIQNHWPYCGGKLPESSEVNGKNEGFSNHSFQVTVGGKKKIIRTNEFGFWKGRINVNEEVTIQDIDKICSLEELKTKYPLPANSGTTEEPMYAYLTPEEWSWRCSLDYVSIGALYSKENIKRNGKIDTLTVVINRTCFTGTNPIIKYIGPKPR